MDTQELALKTYLSLTDVEYDERIAAAKAALGKRLVILAHHYQRKTVFKHADFTGDSLKLARQAAQSEARYIVFCGVHFMAEVAEIISRAEQVAILPDLTAGCSMADMADLTNVTRVWQELSNFLPVEQAVLPITYINSTADLKAFCGQHSGIVCTSGNAPQILTWAFKQREKVLFFPDEHLGRNTAYRLGIPLTEMVMWDTSQPQGGLSKEQILKAKIILWPGFCSVHQTFQVHDINNFRRHYPDAKVIAHPECTFEVCQQADEVGSTEFIIKTIQASPSGTRWLVGTEWHLVNRLAELSRAENKHIHYMSPAICQCSTMFRIDPAHLLWTLENLVAGRVVNQITVAPAVAEWARIALKRMLDVSI